MKKLRAIKDTPENGVKVGDVFEVIGEGKYLVTVEIGGEKEYFTKEPDEEGLSYATWFEEVKE